MNDSVLFVQMISALSLVSLCLGAYITKHWIGWILYSFFAAITFKFLFSLAVNVLVVNGNVVSDDLKAIWPFIMLTVPTLALTRLFK